MDLTLIALYEHLFLHKNVFRNFYVLQESISSTFYAHIFHTKFWRQKLQSFFGFEMFGAKMLYDKRLCKMLMKLTPDWGCWYFLLKEIGAKAVHKMLML